MHKIKILFTICKWIHDGCEFMKAGEFCRIKINIINITEQPHALALSALSRRLIIAK